MPPPPVSGAPGKKVAEGAGVAAWDAGGRWVALAVGVALCVALGVNVARGVDALAVGESLGVAVWVAVARWVVDARADAVPVGVLPPTVGVLTELPVWVDEPCGVGCGVKIDGTEEEGEPPEQAVIVTAMSMAPPVARAAMSHARRDVPGWVVTGMDRRTFMEPPRTAADNGVALL